MQAVRAPTRDVAAGEGAPGRTFPLPGLDDLEHLVLRDRGNLWQRHAPLASFLLPLLLDGVAQHLQPSTRSAVLKKCIRTYLAGMMRYSASPRGPSRSVQFCSNK